MAFSYYILEDGCKPKQVTKFEWDHWKEESRKKENQSALVAFKTKTALSDLSDESITTITSLVPVTLTPAPRWSTKSFMREYIPAKRLSRVIFHITRFCEGSLEQAEAMHDDVIDDVRCIIERRRKKAEEQSNELQ